MEANGREKDGRVPHVQNIPMYEYKYSLSLGLLK
jgi:hypothetical protein